MPLPIDTQFNMCPQCGHDFPRGRGLDGVCEDCASTNQIILDLHNAQYDRWARMTNKERSNEIKRAMQ